MLLGTIGVIGFSFSLPATRLALRDLDPWVVAFGRALVAAALAVLVLRATRAPRPTPRAVALAGDRRRRRRRSASRSSRRWRSTTGPRRTARSSSGLAPAATAVMAVLRAGERPSRAFWLASAAGTLAVLVFAFVSGAGCAARHRPRAAARRRARRAGLCRGRRARPRPRRDAHDLLGARPQRAAAACRSSPCALAPDRVPRARGLGVRLRLRRDRLDVRRVLRLVRRAWRAAASRASGRSSWSRRR